MTARVPNLIGQVFFAAAMVGLGVQNFHYKGFLKGLELTPEWVALHTFWAYLMGAMLMVGGVGIAIHKSARNSALLIAGVFFASVVFLRLPRIGLAVANIGERTVFFEPLTLGCGALLLAGLFEPAARVLIGISMIVFGLDHIQVPRFIASMVPAWIPGGLFWAWFTGFAFIAAGRCIITRWHMRLATLLLGLMFFLWVAIVHAPRIAASPHNQSEWNSGLVALAMCGVSWILTE